MRLRCGGMATQWQGRGDRIRHCKTLNDVIDASKTSTNVGTDYSLCAAQRIRPSDAIVFVINAATGQSYCAE